MNGAMMQSVSIKVKMIVVFLTLTLASLLLMSGLSNYYYSRAVEKDFYTISSQAVSRLNHHMDFYFRQIAQSTTSLIEQDIVQDWLSKRREYTVFDKQELEKELRRYVALNFPEIVGMFLVSKEKDVVTTATHFPQNASFREEPWYDAPLEETMTIIPTHHATNPQAGGNPVPSVIVPIFDKVNLGLTGKLVIQITLKEIRETFGQAALGQTGHFFIVSPDRRIIFHPRTEWIALPIRDTPLASLNLTRHDHSVIQFWKGTKMLLTSRRSESTGWDIASLVPFDEMAGGLDAARNSTFIVFSILALVIILTVPFLAGRLVQPIVQLKGLMHRVARGNLDVRAPLVPGQDEFQQLNHSFNLMVERLDELLNTVRELNMREVHLRLRQKEALIQALQNQINPHLLYNSLDIIKSLAYLEQVPKIETMARNLADVYRYTARISDNEVSLNDELVHLRKYMEIVHLRFPKEFQSRVVVNDKYMSGRVVKLTLQPIVENAVKYAIEPMCGKGAILVSAYDERADLVIEIADNGPGIPADILHPLHAELKQISATVFDEYIQQDSLGLSNVHARLVLKYGVGYGLTVNSFPGRGTVVSVRIPNRPRACD